MNTSNSFDICFHKNKKDFIRIHCCKATVILFTVTTISGLICLSWILWLPKWSIFSLFCQFSCHPILPFFCLFISCDAVINWMHSLVCIKQHTCGCDVRRVCECKNVCELHVTRKAMWKLVHRVPRLSNVQNNMRRLFSTFALMNMQYWPFLPECENTRRSRSK